MNRRSFLVTASAAGLVACAEAPIPKSTAAPADTVQLDVFLVDATTPFAGHGTPYLNALSNSEFGRVSGIEWIALPQYGREGGATISGARVPVADDRQELEAFFAGLPAPWRLPETHELRYGRDAWGDGESRLRWGARVVYRAPVISTGSIVGVEAHDDSVTLVLDAAGTSRLDTQSARNVGQRLAIVVDGEIVADPVINQRIDGGRVQITVRDGTPDSYEALAQQLAG